MAKKKKNAKVKKNEFNSDPFKHLKGFAFPTSTEDEEPVCATGPAPEIPQSFSAEMENLGVKRLEQDEDFDELGADLPSDLDPQFSVSDGQSDEELFLAALGDLSGGFQDSFPDGAATRQAEPRRMKQLKSGKLTPDASLDLHGCKRIDVAAKVSHFLNNSHHHGYSTLLIITGKGLHSQGGEAVLRDETEQFLATAKTNLVAEWGRAPKQYGGHGALAVFLRNK